MKNIVVTVFVIHIALSSWPLWAAQTTVDEKQVIGLIEDFRSIAARTDGNQKIGLFADDYVHVAADGAMTTAWRLAQNTATTPSVTIDKLHVRTFAGSPPSLFHSP